MGVALRRGAPGHGERGCERPVAANAYDRLSDRLGVVDVDDECALAVGAISWA